MTCRPKDELINTYWTNLVYSICSRGDNNAQYRPPPGTISAPFRMVSKGSVLYEFVFPSSANVKDGTFVILSNPFSSYLVNHWRTTNCLPSQSCKNAMHFPKYTFFFVPPSSLSSSISTLTQSCATIPWNRGIARRKIVCTSWKSLMDNCSCVATSTGACNCNTFVVMAFAMLLNMALFALSEIHEGKPSHVSVLR